MTALVPVAVGCTVLADPLVHLILPEDYAGAGLLLALGIWRAPLLILAFLYQTTLIALNRETVGVRSLVAGGAGNRAAGGAASGSVFGLPGAARAVLLLGLGLVLAGYGCLAREGRQPAWHHHLARPLAASLAMVPVCLALAALACAAGGAGRCRHLRRGARVPGRIAPDAGSGGLPSVRPVPDSAAVTLIGPRPAEPPYARRIATGGRP